MPSSRDLESILAKGKDSALLRFSLGDTYLREGNPEKAIEHLAAAVKLDSSYSAAWKLYGKSLVDSGRLQEAVRTYKTGIDIAQQKGDVQAAKEMRVFLKRVEKRI